MRKLYATLAILLFFSILAIGQEVNQHRKQLTTIRVEKAPKIDGVINDDAWKNVEVAKDFFVLRPDNGNKVPNTYQTEVRVIYDNQAIYIAAEMTDPDPENIAMEFTYRDNFGQADFFAATINPNDDGQNPFEFVVMSSGAQAEARVSSGDRDYSWNAVWESKARITEKGWSVEMKIPYRALRFANRPIQSWGFNFRRNIIKENTQHTWNFVIIPKEFGRNTTD